MRPTDSLLNPHVEMPVWLRTLQRALGTNGPPPPVQPLTPLVLLEELARLDGDSLPASPDDRSSLREDLKGALDELGDETAAEMSTAIRDFRANTLGRLQDLLASAEGLRVARAATAVLRDRLTAPEVVASAWRDSVTAFRDNADYETCALRLAQLRELVEHRGHAWDVEAKLLIRIINDSASHAVEAGAEIHPANGENYAFHELAGLDEEVRLGLIEQHLTRPAAEEDAAVWLRFADALIEMGEVEAGSVHYFDAQPMRADVEAERPVSDRYDLPAGDDADYLASFLVENLTADDHAVLARVETTTRQGQAVTTARRKVLDQMAAATLGEFPRGWRLTGGYIVITPVGWGYEGFHDVADTSAFAHIFSNRPDKSLAQLDPRLIAALDEDRADAVDAVELARWEQGLRQSSDDAFRVGLGVRNLERVLPDERVTHQAGRGAHWAQVAAYYLRDIWRWEALERELDDARLYAVTPPYEAAGLGPEGNQKFYAEVKRITGADGHPISRADLVTHASAIAELNGVGSSRRRILEKTAADAATQEAALARLDQLGRDFDALLARTARQRNAAVHGSKRATAVLANVIPFVSALGTRIGHAALEAAAEDVPLIVWLERERLKIIERLASLKAGIPLTQLL
jgi:hypothetical protein